MVGSSLLLMLVRCIVLVADRSLLMSFQRSHMTASYWTKIDRVGIIQFVSE